MTWNRARLLPTVECTAWRLSGFARVVPHVSVADLSNRSVCSCYENRPRDICQAEIKQ